MAAISSRYARALVEVVLEQKIGPDLAVQQVNSLVDVIRESSELRKIWESPSVPPEQKRRLLDAIASKMNLSRTVRNFYAVLIDHQRIPIVEQIARQFEVELDAQLGFAEAQVTSAPLSLALSKSRSEGIELTPSPSARERVGVRVRRVHE